MLTIWRTKLACFEQNVTISSVARCYVNSDISSSPDWQPVVDDSSREKRQLVGATHTEKPADISSPLMFNILISGGDTQTTSDMEHSLCSIGIPKILKPTRHEINSRRRARSTMRVHSWASPEYVGFENNIVIISALPSDITRIGGFLTHLNFAAKNSKADKKTSSSNYQQTSGAMHNFHELSQNWNCSGGSMKVENPRRQSRDKRRQHKVHTI